MIIFQHRQLSKNDFIKYILKVVLLITCFANAGFLVPVYAQELVDRARFQNDHIRLSLIVRTPDQIEAFYSARGFSKSAIEILRQHCFIGISIINDSDEVVWVDPDLWKFQQQESSFQPYSRDFWMGKWKSIDLPLSHQSTFGWTLLPEQRGLFPDEPVGGNIAIPYTEIPFSVHLLFKTGRKKSKVPINVLLENLSCHIQENGS